MAIKLAKRLKPGRPTWSEAVERANTLAELAARAKRGGRPKKEVQNLRPPSISKACA